MTNEKQISPMEARNAISEGEGFYPIDLRTEESFKNFSIKGFHNVPYGEVSRSLPKITSEQQTVILLCENGVFSGKTQTLLENCGVESLVVRGGMETWKKVIDPDI